VPGRCPVGADLKVGATFLCRAPAGWAIGNAIARMRKVSVLGNLIATSRGSCGLSKIGGGDYTENGQAWRERVT
jgi:hypothetical protein